MSSSDSPTRARAGFRKVVRVVDAEPLSRNALRKRFDDSDSPAPRPAPAAGVRWPSEVTCSSPSVEPVRLPRFGREGKAVGSDECEGPGVLCSSCGVRRTQVQGTHLFASVIAAAKLAQLVTRRPRLHRPREVDQRVPRSIPSGQTAESARARFRPIREPDPIPIVAEPVLRPPRPDLGRREAQRCGRVDDRARPFERTRSGRRGRGRVTVQISLRGRQHRCVRAPAHHEGRDEARRRDVRLEVGRCVLLERPRRSARRQATQQPSELRSVRRATERQGRRTFDGPGAGVAQTSAMAAAGL